MDQEDRIYILNVISILLDYDDNGTESNDLKVNKNHRVNDYLLLLWCTHSSPSGT